VMSLLILPYRRLSGRRLIPLFGVWVRFLHKSQENRDQIDRISCQRAFNRIIVVWWWPHRCVGFRHARSWIYTDDQ
jgi:hypothetical protein